MKLLLSAVCFFGSCRASSAQLGPGTPSAGQPAQMDAGTEAHPARVSGGIMAGAVITKVMPMVPREVLLKKVSGTVVLAVVVDPQGKVAKAMVISGPLSLRPYYLDAIRQWTWKPFYLNGQPVFVQTTVTVICDYGAID